MITALLCLLMLVACGSKGDVADSRYVGTWKAVKVALGEASDVLDTDFEITLNADGTGSCTGENGPEDITWKLTSNGFKTSGATKLKFTDEGENIKAKVIGVDLIFEKQN